MIRRLKKPIAILTLLIIITQTFSPTISYALTSGPTSPEATSFEPIDTTDMVNTLTGDFTYNMPLLEVPGPEGGYPLSLSYHAGIQPNEEASWVGLGWTLNPGAISRNVNGYPDDFNDINQFVRSYWSGGSTKTVGVDVGIGFGPASVSFGLSFSQDTYKGFGVGMSAGLGISVSGSPFNIGVSVGVSPYGDSYAGLNIGVSTGSASGQGIGLGAGIGISTNFESVSANGGAGISYTAGNTSFSLLGASISSSGGKASMSIGGGASSINNANQGKIQTESSGWSFSIPLPGISIGVSSNYTRYWSDETEGVYVSGSLYAPATAPNLDNHAYDTYHTLDPSSLDPVFLLGAPDPDPDRVSGGVFPNFDDYSVTAQGLSGTMRPYAYQAVLYSQNVINNNDHSDDIVTRPTSANRQNANGYAFRFDNDFSNSYRQAHTKPSDSYFNFDSPQYGDNDGDFGYDNSKNELIGSKSIKYFTVEQIISQYAKSQGFSSYAGEMDLSIDKAKKIGGFMITNASGVTYHYALPAYSFNEIVYTEKIDRSGGLKFNKLSKPSKYAYTWYLTAITGPDYVDRNNDGMVNANDWGYWVKFDYGKWSSYYNWRNPSEGFNKDIDSDFQSYSSGNKDVYYLNTVRTRSHVAIFEKSDRADSKSITTDSFWANSGIPTDNGSTVSTLKLSKVYLLKAEDYDAINNSGNNPDFPELSFDPITAKSRVPDWNVELRSDFLLFSTLMQSKANVIDSKDIVEVYDAIKEKSIRSIRFNYDYSLCYGVPNSYDTNGNRYYPNNANTLNYQRLGKLTLLSVENLGKNDSRIAPPTEFEYDLDPTLAQNNDNITIADSGGIRRIQVNAPEKFDSGDILKFHLGNSEYFCVLLKKSANIFDVKYIGQAPIQTASGIINAVKTKNPPYNKDAVDAWGLYKSDYTGASSIDNLNRLTTSVSNKSTDVWSLRKIKTQLGADINIDYEGDDYNSSVMNRNKSFIISNLTNLGNNNFSFDINSPGIDISEFAAIGDKIDILLLRKFTFPGNSTFYSFNNVKNPVTDRPVIVAMGSNRITIKVSPQFNNQITDNGSGNNAILTGNVIIRDNDHNFGGGIRVKEISIGSSDGYIKKTHYNYKIPVFASSQSMSSGVTSYEPTIFDVTNAASVISGVQPNDAIDAVRQYKSLLHRDIYYLLSLARSLPAPGVMYEYVQVTDETIDPDGRHTEIPGSTSYQYEVFNSGMLGRKEYNLERPNGGKIVNMAIKDYTSRIGNLKRVITYDNAGNKLTEIINHYLHDPLVDKSFETQVSQYDLLLAGYHNQGVIQERYGDSRFIKTSVSYGYKTAYFSGYQTVVSGNDFYPAIQTGVTQIDYKNGTKVQQENLSYDFYNGLVSKVLTTDGYGNRFVNETVPAYRIYPEMGLRVNEAANGKRKNMLTQQAVNKIYKVDFNNQPIGLLSATAQTWGVDIPVIDPFGDNTTIGQADIWRKKANYSWVPEGSSTNNITAIGSFQDYFTGGANNPSWKQTSEIKLYDVYSHALEATDINKKYAATKMGHNSSKVILSGGMARYAEIAYSGAEDGFIKNGETVFGGNVKTGNGAVVSTTAHTGIKSLSLPGSGKGFTYAVSTAELDPNRRSYSVSAWVKPEAGDISGARLFYQVDNGTETYNNPTFQKQAAGWYLLEMTIPASAVNNGTLNVGVKNLGTSNVYVDDFRFHPVDAVTTAYVYNQFGELSHVLDNNNLFVKFEYDNAGKLAKTYKEVLGKPNTPLIKEYAYNYGKMTRSSWLNTGNTRCEQLNGTYTGYEEIEQKDSNPTSQTYNQIKWIKGNLVNNCLPTIYARLEPNYTYYSSYAEGAFTVRFFANAACTIPASAGTTLTVNYQLNEDISSGIGSQHREYNYASNASAGVSDFLLCNYITYQCGNIAIDNVATSQKSTAKSATVQRVEMVPPGDDSSCTNRSVLLLPGNGYTIVN